MRYGFRERLDDATLGLVLVLAGSAIAWTGGGFLYLVTRPADLVLVSALLGAVSLAAVVVVVWGVYFGVRALREYSSRRRVAWAAVVIGGITLLPWVIYTFGVTSS